MTEMTNTSYKRPIAVATTVLLTGVAASLAGNVQAINLDNASPGIGAHISAIFWPLVLFGIVELLLHTPWLANWRDRLTKGAAVLLVGGVAAWVSYWHLANVLSHYGYDVASRYAGPLAIDAAMVLATLALNRIGQARKLAKTVAMDNAWTGPVASVQDVAESEAAFRGQTEMAWADRLANLSADVLDTDEDMFARLEREMSSGEPPVVPVPVSAPPARRRASRGTVDAAEARNLAMVGRDNGLPAGDIAELLAGHYGVSARTIRREPWWKLDSQAA